MQANPTLRYFWIFGPLWKDETYNQVHCHPQMGSYNRGSVLLPLATIYYPKWLFIFFFELMFEFTVQSVPTPWYVIHPKLMTFIFFKLLVPREVRLTKLTMEMSHQGQSGEDWNVRVTEDVYVKRTYGSSSFIGTPAHSFHTICHSDSLSLLVTSDRGRFISTQICLTSFCAPCLSTFFLRPLLWVFSLPKRVF